MLILVGSTRGSGGEAEALPGKERSDAQLRAGGTGAARPRVDDGGYVDLPLESWLRRLERLDRRAPEPTPPADVILLERTLRGEFHKGLLRATLVTRFEVLRKDGHVQVAVLDQAASAERVRVDGAPGSLIEDGEMYAIGVDRAGVHEVEITFYLGQEDDEFTRHIEMRLPAGGITRLAVVIPERDVEPHLASGVVTKTSPSGSGTLIEGFADPSGAVDLSWSRRITHDRATAAKVQARHNGVFTVREDVIDGIAAFAIEPVEGELDRIDFQLPADVEVSGVTGDAVLQWRREGTALVVLLRYLVSDPIDVAVRFQYAADLDRPIPLHLPAMSGGDDLGGAIGVRAPAGLHVGVASVERARALELRDLPAELTALSDSPLLFGFQFAEPPAIRLSASRLGQVELTSTLIDGIEAISVLLEDGTEITKMRMYIRNNTRQYLRVELPGGAVLTHALLDGDPVRPAALRDSLLFSLRQSERVDPALGRMHTVRAGDTLRDIAHHYYSDPDKWTVILEANGLADATDLVPGQSLKVPSTGPVTIEESSFVLELAYRRARAPLGRLGTAAMTLPEVDADALSVTWHLYLPASIEPLRFDANLTQLSHIRYGALQRLRQFFDLALGGGEAWAGGDPDGYESILARRKGIYIAGAGERSSNDVSPATFPLVGERYRFKRILVDGERPRIDVAYASDGVAMVVRWGAMVAAFALTWLVVRARRLRSWRAVVAALGLVGLVVLAHFVLGVHRRLVWGIDLALVGAVLVPIARRVEGTLAQLVRAPWTVIRLIRIENLLVAVAIAATAHGLVRFPLLLSLAAMVVLAGIWIRQRAGQEVPHA